LGAFSTSGNWVVVFSGTLDSGVRENTGKSSAWRAGGGGFSVMARLLGAALWLALGLMGRTYCCTT
jgi:hypothetical protein